MSFSVAQRDKGHWDITSREGRLFRIRGEYPKFIVYDERPNSQRKETKEFLTERDCMIYICDILMF